MEKIEKSNYLNPTVCAVFCAFVGDISAVSYVSKFYRSVVFSSGKDWKGVYFTPTKARFAEPPARNTAGVIYAQRLVLPFPGDDESILTSFDNWENQRFIVKVVFSNGTSKLIGSKTNPATFLMDFSTESGGSQITFQCDSQSRAYLLQ